MSTVLKLTDIMKQWRAMEGDSRGRTIEAHFCVGCVNTPPSTAAKLLCKHDTTQIQDLSSHANHALITAKNA
eukprot:15365300-Ditylum_brightwellii.AAC.1